MAVSYFPNLAFLKARIPKNFCRKISTNMSLSSYPAVRSSFLHTRSSSTFPLYFLFLTVPCVGSWPCQFLDVFLLSMCDVVFGKKKNISNLFTIASSFKQVVHFIIFLRARRAEDVEGVLFYSTLPHGLDLKRKFQTFDNSQEYQFVAS